MGDISGIISNCTKAATRVFYVLRRDSKNYFYAGGSYAGTNFNAVPDAATKFDSPAHAAKALAQTTCNGRYKVDLVRVERTTVPGKVIPAETVRALLPDYVSPRSTDKWALQNELAQNAKYFLADVREAGPQTYVRLDKAQLFNSSADLVRAIAKAVRDTACSIQVDLGLNIVRVRETITPESFTPDTVTETLTVLE